MSSALYRTGLRLSFARRHSFPRHGRLYRPKLEVLESRELLSGFGTAPDQLQAIYGQLPLSFEANQGQTDPQVNFLSRGSGYTLFLTPTEAALALHKLVALEADGAGLSPAAPADVLRMGLAGGNPAAGVIGLDPLAGTSSYFTGNDPSRWRSNIPTYGRVEYRDVYPGIDLTYYGNQQQLEYDFVVGPGADPGAIALSFQGAEGVSLDAAGNLIVQTAGGDAVEHAPVMYQDTAGGRQAVSGQYVLEGPDRVGFQVGPYDRSRPLTIDPVLTYSTYLGAGGYDYGNAIAVDAAGNAYITGYTDSYDFPTQNPIQSSRAGLHDAFVTKINAAGTALVYSTYLGGSGDDYGNSIAVDSAGNAYVTGYTYSNDFPTRNPLQPNKGNANSTNAFVAEISAAGRSLVYSTYLGGGGTDRANAIAVDSAGSAYVTGSTSSTNFPTRNALQPTYGGGPSDAFVTKVSAGGTSLVYSTYLGGGVDSHGANGTDYGNAIAVDAGGDAYVTGYTDSNNFPTRSALQPTYGGNADAFVTKINAAGTALVYSTYLGGSSYDQGTGIAVDSSNYVYVTGFTTSSNFPTYYPLQQSGGVFLTKISPAGTALIYSTYLDGNQTTGIALDSSSNVYVTGWATNGDITIRNAVQPTFGGGFSDAFVTKINAAGTALVYSTYLGGSGEDRANGIAVDSAGSAYVTGYTYSTDFPTRNALQPMNAASGRTDAFIAKINDPPAATHLGVSAPTSSTAGTSFSITVTALDTSNHTDIAYRGTVHFASTDSQALLPSDYTFTEADYGVHTFPVTLRTAGSQSLTVTDTATSSITGTAAVLVNPAAASTFVVAGFPSPVNAGAAGTFTVTAKDAYGNTVTGYTGTVRFSSTDPQAVLPGNYTFVAGDNGVHTFNATLKTAGTQTLSATDTVMTSLTGSQAGIVVNPLAASSVMVAGFPSPVHAGFPGSFTVTLKDPYGNTATSYRGTLHFTSSDPQGMLPADYTFTGGDGGAHTFSATLKTTGTQALTATDTAAMALTGTQAGIVVDSPFASLFVVTGFPSPTIAGTAGQLTVTAKDAYGNVATGYTGTVRFSSSDPQAGLPANYTFTPGDSGVHVFPATLRTAGTQSITVTDTASSGPTGTQGGIVITPAAISVLAVSGYPSPVAAGIPNTFTVSAQDAYGNTVPGYLGTVHFTSSDAQADLPANYTFTGADNSTHIFAAVLKTAGSQSLTATDTATAGLTGTQAGIVVQPGTARALAVSGFPSPVMPGAAGTFTVRAVDTYGNTAPDYAGTVTFGSTDPRAELPADYTFMPADGGSHTFGAVLFTGGTQAITATDTVSESITGTQAGIVVTRGQPNRHPLVDAIPVGPGGPFGPGPVDPDAGGFTGMGTLASSEASPALSLPPDDGVFSADTGMGVTATPAIPPDATFCTRRSRPMDNSESLDARDLDALALNMLGVP
jgi:hypothetical protein